ncbi:MAG TPA: pentapeptide repeat-containing protein, partial [Candidatus Krumholzibacteria bacterium]|nr:pentapeptide repeat-containing protein [Candidatus Krumholzibacteria bacterium]
DLSDADLSDADLSDADLSDADLSGANLSDADLRDADLSRADLRDADLSRADLRGANLDYSCWSLSCCTKFVTVDDRIARQLAAHVCAIVCDSPEYAAARAAILQYAQGSHRAADLELIDRGEV